MPAARFHPGKLYDSEIGTLQRILRFMRQDSRYTEAERATVSASVATIVATLGNVQNRVVNPSLTVKGKA